MIVQSAPPGEPAFIVYQVDHARAAGLLAEAFGNDLFTPLEPLEPMLFVTRHHDEGWTSVDAKLLFDANTGLPYHLVNTPFSEALITNRASPDFNAEHHPLCGLLSSMHSCGFYNGRYGLYPPRPRDLPAEQRASLEAMLEHEQERQRRLKKVLRARDETRAWVEDNTLMRNYRRLQFFDLLALYFQLNGEHAREPATLAQGTDEPRARGRHHRDATRCRQLPARALPVRDSLAGVRDPRSIPLPTALGQQASRSIPGYRSDRSAGYARSLKRAPVFPEHVVYGARVLLGPGLAWTMSQLPGPPTGGPRVDYHGHGSGDAFVASSVKPSSTNPISSSTA